MTDWTARAVAWHTRHRFLLSFATLSLFMGISVGLAKVTTSLYALQLGAQGWWLGAIAAAQSVGILLTALPMGLWVERFGPRRLFMLGSLAGGALYAVLPLIPSAAFLLGMTVLTGIVMPSRFVSLQTIFMTMLHQIGSANAGWQRAAHMSGMFLLGPLLTASVVAHLGHAGSYWLVALMFVLTVGLSQPVLRHPLPGLSPRTGAQGGLVIAMAQLLAHREARNLAAAEACVQAINMYHAFFIVVIAVQELGIPATVAGSLVAVQGASFIAALLLLGPAVQRLGARAAAAGAALASLGCTTLGLGDASVALLAGSACLGLGIGLIEIGVIGRMAVLGTQLGQSRMAGLNAVAGPGGALLGGLAGGSLGNWLGLQPVYLLFVPVLWLVMSRRTT